MPAKKKIDPLEVEKLSAIGATVEEISRYLHCGRATLHRRFQQALESGRASGSLRAKGRLYEKAVGRGEYKSLELYLINVCGWATTKPPISVVNTLVQTGAPQSPDALRETLLSMRAAIMAEAAHRNGEGASPRLPAQKP
jgi:hypothetical protein